MKPEVIQNQYDGPHAPAKRLIAGQISLDFASSDDASEIDAGIRESIKGLGFARLTARGLYGDLNYHSMNDYLETLCTERNTHRGKLQSRSHRKSGW